MTQNENKRLHTQICFINYPYLTIEAGISLIMQKKFQSSKLRTVIFIISP